MITVIKDVDIFEHIPKYDITMIGTNINCSLGNGIQRDIALNYPHADRENKKTRYGDPSKIGTILTCEEEGEPTIALLYIVKGYPKKKGDDWLNYEALEKCLKLANILYKGKNVACPMLGCSRWDGNGQKERVMEIISKTVTNFDLTIYDYFQKSRNEKQIETYHKEKALRLSGDFEAWDKTIKERKRLAEERFKKNGHARY